MFRRRQSGVGLRPEMPADGAGDVLLGGSRDDLLIGGEGRDLLVGGWDTAGEQRRQPGEFRRRGRRYRDAGFH